MLVKVFVDDGHAKEAVALLRSEAFGLQSRYAEQDSQLILNLVLSAYEATEATEEASTFCRNLLLYDGYKSFDCLNNDRVLSILRQSIKGSINSEYVYCDPPALIRVADIA